MSLDGFITEELYRRVLFLETDVAEAMALQDFGMLDRLVIIQSIDPALIPPAVASLLPK